MVKRGRGALSAGGGEVGGAADTQSTELGPPHTKRGKLDDAEDERAHELLLALQRRSKSLQEQGAREAKAKKGPEAAPVEARPRLAVPRAITPGGAKVTRRCLRAGDGVCALPVVAS
jgi:hypothetical protein